MRFQRKFLLLFEEDKPESYDELLATGHPPGLAKHIVRTQKAVQQARERENQRREALPPEERRKEIEAARRRSELGLRQTAGERRASQKQSAGTPWLTASFMHGASIVEVAAGTGRDERQRILHRRAASGDQEAKEQLVRMKTRDGDHDGVADLHATWGNHLQAAEYLHGLGRHDDARQHLVNHLQSNIFPHLRDHISNYVVAAKGTPAGYPAVQEHHREKAKALAAKASELADRFGLQDVGVHYPKRGNRPRPRGRGHWRRLHLLGLAWLHRGRNMSHYNTTFDSEDDAMSFHRSYQHHYARSHAPSEFYPAFGDETRSYYEPAMVYHPARSG